MKITYSLSILLVLMFLFGCKENKKTKEDPLVIEQLQTKIDFDEKPLNQSIWYGTAFNGNLVYMKLDGIVFYLLEVDTNNQEYIETFSNLSFELKDSICFMSNSSVDLGPTVGYTFLCEYFLNNNLQDSLLDEIILSELTEYRTTKKQYFPMHFKNNLRGELNLSTLDEITFKDSFNQVVLKVKKDTFYSKYVDPGFEGRRSRPLSESKSFKYSFKTDSSTIDYHLSSGHNVGVRLSYFRETLNGEKEVKWRGYIITTYRRDFLILEYNLLSKDVTERPEFVKIIKLDSSLHKYPFNGRY